MKQKAILTALTAIVTGMFLSSCQKDGSFSPAQAEEETNVVRNARMEGTKVRNPYSLKVMQEALDSLLLSTKAVSADTLSWIELKANTYYVRVSSLDTLSIQTLEDADVELFDYPLDEEFDEDAEYCYDPEDPDVASGKSWYYTTLSSDLIDDPLIDDEEEDDDDTRIPVTIGDKLIAVEVLEECYLPELDDATKGGSLLPVSAEALEAMAFKIAGVKQDAEGGTKALAVAPAGYVYFNNGTSDIPVKGVKIRAQKLLRWSTTYTDDNGKFSMFTKFASKPNISIIYSNKKDFDVWGNWAFLAPATYTVTSCRSAANFTRTFYRSGTFAPWSWSVVNNAAYDYYESCTSTSGSLYGVATPPSNMKIWCLNLDLGGTKGSAPMMKHLTTVKVLATTVAVLTYLTSMRFGARFLTSAIAAAVRIAGPDLFIVTHNAVYKELTATTYHELSHASHFQSIGEWNYSKLIWYEITHGDDENLYGTGETGDEGEGLCELSETYAFSIQNYILDSVFDEDSPDEGSSTFYFFREYVKTLSSIMIDGILTPGEVYSCMTKSTSDMDTLLSNLCNTYTDKADSIQVRMTVNGL